MEEEPSQQLEEQDVSTTTVEHKDIPQPSKYGQGRGKKGYGLGSKGLGKGGIAHRHRKTLRDNIQGVTKPAIRRLARRGAVASRTTAGATGE